MLCTRLGTSFGPEFLLNESVAGSGMEEGKGAVIGVWVEKEVAKGKREGNPTLFPAAQCFPGSSSSAPVTPVLLCKGQRS